MNSVETDDNVTNRSESYPLPGTATEIQALQKFITKDPITLTDEKATPAALSKILPKVRYAHLATHGFFDVDTLAHEKERAKQAEEGFSISGESQPAVAVKNPLGFVGLVVSNQEILSGISLADLPLDDLQLVTLSACETGLGGYSEGIGHQSLQHAFHLAGCKNVVASLWQVNDDSTSAIMNVFYHELLLKKKSPIEALRTAQLYLYYNPTQVDTLVKRGPPRLGVVVKAPKVDPATPRPRRAATKDWAAFVLSGLGQ